MIMELRKKSQITIPKEITKKLGLREGDKLEIKEKDGLIQIIPVAIYPKAYVDGLKAEIQEIKESIANGSHLVFDNVDDLFEHLENKE